MTTRVRFAPSPTGFLHLGGLRTALFNYLFAAKNNGKLILRIEDTDQSRTVPGSVEYLQNTFKWLKINFDESPLIGGPHTPYIQSERLSIYRKYAKDLIKTDGAYPCFCSKERLQSLRINPSSSRRGYDGFCRNLSFKDIQERIQMGTPHVIRLKVPRTDSTSITDVVYGDVVVKNEDIDDQVLLKTDGFPTYHLANVIDDHIMEISHVLRGEEWLPSTCKHKLLYEAFGWSAPVFVHIPLLLTRSGSKLSKRNKDLHVQSYKERGYSPEGLINYIALLGWNPKTEKEIFTLDELIDAFNLEGINKAAAIVDEGKLDWLNSVHVQRLFKDDSRMVNFVNDLRVELLSRKPFNMSPNSEMLNSRYLSTIINFIKERTCLIPNIPDQAPYFWIEPEPAIEKLKSLPKADEALEMLLSKIVVSDFTKELLQASVISLQHFNGLNIKLLLRQCITDGLAGPDIMETMLIIGKQRTIDRIKKSILVIQQNDQ